MSQPISDTVTITLIRDEAMALLRGKGPESLHPTTKILLASVLFADSEGVAHLGSESLRRWCAGPDRRRASQAFIDRRIEELLAAGALAPGSTPKELISMLAYRETFAAGGGRDTTTEEEQ